MRHIDTIVIHCSATANGVPLTASGETPAKVIDRWHRARKFARSWDAMVACNPDLTSIGYHYVIGIDGTVYPGRSLAEVGAHAQGHNATSVGICMVGMDAYTAAQWDALREVVSDLLRRYPIADVVGHRDLSPDLDGDGIVERDEWTKTCPGFDVRSWAFGSMAPPAGHLLEP